MMNLSGSIDTAAMTVEQRLDALISAFNRNNYEFHDGVNELCDIVVKHKSEIDKLTKRMKGKASKLGLMAAIIGGVLYIIKNECDKDDLRKDLIDIDKRQHGIGDGYRRSVLEDEGEALNPTGI